MPWWSWILIWVALVALSLLFYVLLGIRLFRQFMATMKDLAAKKPQLDMLGVTAHYLDEQLRVKTVLLGLRPMYGAHSGAAIAEELLALMREFKISDRVGYFVADNASNNDAALREMAKEIDIEPLRQRIRCNAHVLTLLFRL